MSEKPWRLKNADISGQIGMYVFVAIGRQYEKQA
jgi:hypothetical protein